MPSTRLKKFLDERRIKYVSIRHSPAFTAQEIAESAHVPGQDFAKTVIVKLGEKLAMVVLPASRRIMLPELRDVLGAEEVRLADEHEFESAFPDCEVGAMPPFGNLYGMPVYVSASLADEPEIAFNAGTHSEIIRMAYADFAESVKPEVVDFVGA